MSRRLSDDEVEEGLNKLPGWRKEGAFIVQEFEFDEFMDGIAFVNRVAEVAEGMDHHPDVHIRYPKVTLLIQTHSEGGLTEKDLKLAGRIEKAES